ncbi:MAG: single-stranded DNA-binding protein, partial [Bacteroidetes bacterium]|nr:single-stranded DNA-binding protein [Bacteroidota bacterium]
MTNLVNSVRLIGNVGRTPEVKLFNTGRKKASLSLATTEKRRNDSGEYISHTEWHNLICWGKQADVVERFVKKGSRLVIEGKLTHRDYT